MALRVGWIEAAAAAGGVCAAGVVSGATGSCGAALDSDAIRDFASEKAGVGRLSRTCLVNRDDRR
jgi:hypothetical protein